MTTVPPKEVAAGSTSSSSGTNVNEWAEYFATFRYASAVPLYHATYAGWVRHLRQHDHHGLYYHFALTAQRPSIQYQQRASSMYRPWRQVCEALTVKCFPRFSKSHPDRHPAEHSFGAIVVPSISASGLIHDHGWLRVPRQAPQNRVKINIRVRGEQRTVDGPKALGDFVYALVHDRKAPFFDPTNGTSMWLHHMDGEARPDSPDDPDPGWKYLLKTADRELREWGKAEQIPTRVFSRLLDQIEPFEPERIYTS